MANATHVPFRVAALKKQVDHLNDDVVVVLVGGTYAANPETHEFLSSVSSEDIVATSDPLTGKSVSATAQAISSEAESGVLFEEVTDTAHTVLVVHHTGNPATSRIAASYTKRRDALGTELDISIVDSGSDVRVPFLDGVLYSL